MAVKLARDLFLVRRVLAEQHYERPLCRKVGWAKCRCELAKHIRSLEKIGKWLREAESPAPLKRDAE